MPKVTVIITVDAAADLDAIKAECQRHGLTGVTILSQVGLLTGVIDDLAIGELKNIPGVRAVELERKISVGPPR
jgi:hypothetical protein